MVIRIDSDTKAKSKAMSEREHLTYRPSEAPLKSLTLNLHLRYRSKRYKRPKESIKSLNGYQRIGILRYRKAVRLRM